MVSKVGPKNVFTTGAAVVTIGVFVLSRISADSAYVTILLPGLLLTGMGFSTFFASSTITATMDVPNEQQGLVGGLLNTSVQFGTALCIVLLTAIAVLAIIITAYLPDTVDSEPGQTGLGFVLVPIVPLYSALLQGLWHGQTVGKRCLGIAVRSLDGAEIRLGRSFGRSYTRAATWIFFPVWILDSLWPLWEGRRRALHDLAAGTIVITRRTDTQ
jgi:uncharacterized RDD family membrane protein YckC